MYAYASNHVQAAQSLLAKIESAILFPLMGLLVAVAMLMFIWGGFEFVMNAESDQGRETGRRHMLYGVIGLLIIISAYAILKVALMTFGVPIPN